MIYLASPYTHSDPTIMELRFVHVMKVLAEKYLRNGVPAYSPIVHYHDLAKIYDLPKSHEFWLMHDRAMIDVCSEVHVVRLEGWEQSKGVAAEIAYSNEIGKPIIYV